MNKSKPTPGGRAKKNPAVSLVRSSAAEYLRTREEMAAYLEACLEESNGDASFVVKALGDIARAKGMTQVAREKKPLARRHGMR